MLKVFLILISVLWGIVVFLVLNQLFSGLFFAVRKIKSSFASAGGVINFVENIAWPESLKFLFKGTSERYWQTARMPRKWSFKLFISLKIITFFLAIILAIIFIFYLENFWLGLFFILAAYFLPDYFIKKRSRDFSNIVNKTLPEIIDLLRLQSQMGLNLESSLVNLHKNRKDFWREVLESVVFEIKSGLEISLVLQNLSKKFDSLDLHRFVSAIKQSKALGVSLSETLGIQANALRVRRRQLAEEQAGLASVKISFPLVFFVFPALLIIYLAPAVLRILEIK